MKYALLFLLFSEDIPDYRNGRPNALVCNNEGVCRQCSHAKAQKYQELSRQGKFDGGIVFLPLNQKP